MFPAQKNVPMGTKLPTIIPNIVECPSRNSPFGEEFAELETTATQTVHIRLAVTQNFGLKVELVLTLDLVVVPCIKLFAVIGTHAIRIVELGFRHWPHVVLVLRTVKEMREVTFLKLCETKRFRECGEFYWDEAKRIDELNVHL
jgi:hypothetical protein